MLYLRHYQRAAVRAASGMALLVTPALLMPALVMSALVASALRAPILEAQTAVPLTQGAPSPVTWKDGRLLGAFALATAAAMPADAEVQRVMQRRWVQESPLLTHSADLFNAYGSPGVFAGSLALFAAGWASERPDLARLGLRAGEAIMVSGIVTGGIKGFAGRARPYASPGNPRDFRMLSGTHDAARQSFPSGHTTAVFAFASAMQGELRVSHPRTARWAGPALYTAAALTGLARLHADKHWASDVMLGAGIGLVSGQVVTRFHADRPRYWIDEHLLPRARP